jgi:hypothetical protein
MKKLLAYLYYVAVQFTATPFIVVGFLLAIPVEGLRAGFIAADRLALKAVETLERMED